MGAFGITTRGASSRRYQRGMRRSGSTNLNRTAVATTPKFANFEKQDFDRSSYGNATLETPKGYAGSY
jgi:hypothetical protein